MARLQILELPGEHRGDRPPFILVVDQAVPQRYAVGPDTPVRDYWQDIADQIGARAAIVTPETVDIPANEVGGQAKPLLRVGEFDGDEEILRLTEERDELHAEIGIAHGQLHSTALSAIRGKHANIRELIERAEQAEAARDEARQWARHGYEIGQKHCGWTDYGVAPDWLTEGWPNSFDSCEHLKRAAELEESEAIRKRVAKESRIALLDALGMDHTRDWDDIRNAAAGIRKQRDAQAEMIERVRALPERPETMAVSPEQPYAYMDGYAAGISAARAATEPEASDR